MCPAHLPFEKQVLPSKTAHERGAFFAGGERILERDPREHWVTRITIKAHDSKGRHMTAVGVPVSRVILNRHTFIDINSLIRWELDGVVAYGEDQDMWPIHRWARRKRQRGA